MPSCEKCWRDAGGRADEYSRLVKERQDNPCSPEEQAGGEDARECPECGRKTLHAYCNACMACDYYGDD